MPFHLIVSFVVIASFLPVQEAEAGIPKCSEVESLTIGQALNWLRQNMGRLDEQMGKGGLSPWLGRTRDRFTERLNKSHSLVVCARGTACAASKTARIRLGDWDLPVRHKTRIELCPANLSGIGQYVVVIAHELGHLVWANADRRNCLDRCTHPRLSDSLTLAAYHAWHSTGHAAAQCPVMCGIKPAILPMPSADPNSVNAVAAPPASTVLPESGNAVEGLNSP